MKKFGFGVLWFLALSMGCLMVGGMVVSAMAGINDPVNASASGEAAGTAFGREYAGIIYLVSLIIAVLGSIKGWLPGTKLPTV
jgi:hypothetical protein